MSVISTTNPVPPQGDTPTIIPFEISSSVSLNSVPRNISIQKNSMLNSNHGIYLGKFTIDTTQAVGTKVFSWNSLTPLSIPGSSLYIYATTTGGLENPLVPWDLLTYWYSALNRTDYLLEFIVVKVGDCRVSLDFIIDYNFTPDSVYNTTALANDSFHVILDDQDDQFSFVPPLYYMTELVNTRPPRIGELATDFNPPWFMPRTRVSAFIRSPYQPNMTQPLNFEVVVKLVPIVRSTQGITSISSSAVRPFLFEG